jgi:uncharacterized protein YdiU (UPF0061 family)
MTPTGFAFDNSYARDLPGFYVPWQPEPVAAPQLLFLNRDLAEELQLPLGDCDDAALAALFSGNALPEGATPIAQAYAGHQFGQFSPKLGDGRALLVGEVIDAFPAWYRQHWLDGMRTKLGLASMGAAGDDASDTALVDDWLTLLHTNAVDFTLAWRRLADAAEGRPEPLQAMCSPTGRDSMPGSRAGRRAARPMMRMWKAMAPAAPKPCAAPTPG